MQNQCLFFPYRKVRFFRLHYERVKYKFWIKSIMDPIWTPYQCDISKIIMYQNFSLKKRAWNISRAIFDGSLQTQLGLDDFLIMKPLLVCQTSQIIMKLRHPPPPLMNNAINCRQSFTWLLYIKTLLLSILNLLNRYL